jgi:hypothetical protein
MSPATLTQPVAAAGQSPSGRYQTPVAGDEFQALWAMTRDERIAAMWRSELTQRQLSQWSSRAQHEVPLLGGEFAWIAMRTPEWAEAGNRYASRRVPEHHHQAEVSR